MLSLTDHSLFGLVLLLYPFGNLDCSKKILEKNFAYALVETRDHVYHHCYALYCSRANWQ